jgi:hypothetical protein
VAVGGLSQPRKAALPGYCQQEMSAQYPEKNTRNMSSTDWDVEAQHNQKGMGKI